MLTVKIMCCPVSFLTIKEMLLVFQNWVLTWSLVWCLFVSLHKIVLYQVFHEDIISASSTRILALCNFNLWIKVLQLQESLLLYFGGFCFVLFCFSFFCSFSGPIFRNPRILYSDLLSRPIIFLKNWS